jgi:hypothetical protein
MLLQCARYDDLMMSCHLAGPIPNEVWNDFMLQLREKPFTRFIGASLGTVEPNSVQRSEIFTFFHRRHVKLVCVTDEQFVRGIITAASWVGINARAFPWVDLRAAIEHSGFTDQTSVARVEKQMLTLRSTLEAHDSRFAKRAV